MKRPVPLFLLPLLFVGVSPAADTPAPRPNLVILDAVGVQNLRLETAVAEPGEFEETVFALGRIEARPGHVAAVASRISGHVVALAALPGDHVTAGTEVVKVESRQPGTPAPVIGLKAPLSGTVTQLGVRLGDPVEPDRALLEITDLSEVLAIARVPESSLGGIKPGVTAHIHLPATPDRKVEGRFVRLGTTVDPASGTIDVTFLVANPDGLIRPGMRAEFSLVIGRRSDVTSVPRSALQGDASGRFVYVKDFDLPHAFLKTPVVVGQSNDRRVEIVRGLLPADEVVTQGAHSLAFAGGGSVSLKSALDAAHGHEHNADGSELTAQQKAKSGSAARPDAESPHDHDHEHASPFWMILSAVLFALLVVVSIRHQKLSARLADSAASPRAND